MAVKGLYLTSREWDTAIFGLPFVIGEDPRFVMGDARLNTPYRPMPFEDFAQCIRDLEKIGTRLRYEDMHEPIDMDHNQASLENRSNDYFLVSGALARVRKESSKKIDSIHTLLLVGQTDRVISVSQRLNLPHPFEKAFYPYRKLFMDPSKTVEVLN